MPPRVRIMSSGTPNVARAQQLLQTQRLLEDAQRLLLTLADCKAEGKDAVKRAEDDVNECNYALHRCEHAWKLQEQLKQQQQQQQQQAPP